MSAQALASGSRWSDAAVALAHRVASLAVPDAAGDPVWFGDDLDPMAVAAGAERPPVVAGRLDEGLLTGRAGIALALAACSRLPSADPRWAGLARRAAAVAVRSELAEPTGRLGWDAGALGIARAAWLVGSLTGDRAALADAERLGGAAVRQLLVDPRLVPPWADLLGGVAGVLAGVVCAPLRPGDEGLRGPAVRLLVARLEELSVEDAAGARWSMATTTQPVAGLAHGASGIALALREAALLLEAGASGPRLVGPDDAVVVAARARRLADAALRWEQGLRDPASGGWPDLRSDPPVPGLAWCHGAPGIGVCAALVAASEPGSRAAAHAHSTYVRAVGASRLHRPGRERFDGTLCHGLAGVVELHLLGSRAWASAAGEHLRLARAVADHLVGVAGGPGWTCGVRDGRTPNLLVGVAGVALTLARCHDPAVGPSPADPLLRLV